MRQKEAESSPRRLGGVGWLGAGVGGVDAESLIGSRARSHPDVAHAHKRGRKEGLSGKKNLRMASPGPSPQKAARGSRGRTAREATRANLGPKLGRRGAGPLVPPGWRHAWKAADTGSVANDQRADRAL